MLAAHVRVVRAAVGADGAGKRRILRIDVVAVERGIGFQRRQDGAHERRVVEHFGRNALQAAQFVEELARREGAGGGTWLRRNCGARAAGSDQQRGQAARPAAQQAGQLERHRGSHAVAEEGEGLREVRLDGVGEGLDQRRHALEGRFGEARFAARQADGDVRPSRADRRG